ncbi:nitrate reductase delta subunit [Neisseria sp. HSC-16F19]|nr:nitrate reductase molybdenum cofactor assembly chaperone [Neisseria sp. HSC-16F19]MCP2040685.1 nitrate reductase delta subunit [Neisseria sp. HSC-16F19]
MSANPVYKWFSALMCYPEAELVEALPEFQAALASWPELRLQADKLQGFLDYLAAHPLRTLQENYVKTFDHNRHHALYIFEHVYGEDRDRGSAMVDLLDEYRSHGFELGDDELPDYLPALLEYFSYVDNAHAQKLLGDAVHVIAHIGGKLAQNGSPYAALLAGVTALSPVAPQPLIEPPVRDMDEAMETFGPDVSGFEPLLKPSIETIQFYPKAAYQTAREGA